MHNQTVNGYTLNHQLGEGGMAEVWYAENRIGKKSAIKVIKKELALLPDLVNRFENEAKVMVSLTHPYIRQVYDYALVDNRPCIIMEYLEGADLSARLKRGERFSQPDLVSWWNQLVEVLNFTHASGVVHRDIKPSNIFLTTEGNLKLLDFGIAKIKGGLTHTLTGTRMGTLLYMSPEQVKDSKHIDHRTDVYSLAVTFFHMITGAAPYDNTKSSEFEIQTKIVTEPLDLGKLPEQWRWFLEPFLSKELEKRPELEPFRTINTSQIGSSKEAGSTTCDPPKPPPKPTQVEPPQPKPTPTPNPKPVPTPTSKASSRTAAWKYAAIGLAVVIMVFVVRWFITPNPGYLLTSEAESARIADSIEMADSLLITIKLRDSLLKCCSEDSLSTKYTKEEMLGTFTCDWIRRIKDTDLQNIMNYKEFVLTKNDSWRPNEYSTIEPKEINKFITDTKMPLHIADIVKYNSSRYIHADKNGFFSYDYFPCKFFIEDGLLCFKRNGGSISTCGVLYKKDSFNYVFLGGKYCEGDSDHKLIYEKQNSFAAILFKTSSQRLIMLSINPLGYNSTGEYEIYDFTIAR